MQTLTQTQNTNTKRYVTQRSTQTQNTKHITHNTNTHANAKANADAYLQLSGGVLALRAVEPLQELQQLAHEVVDAGLLRVFRERLDQLRRVSVHLGESDQTNIVIYIGK